MGLKSLTVRKSAGISVVGAIIPLLTAIAGCGVARAEEPSKAVRVETPEGVARPPFTFEKDDEALLDEVQRGAFKFLWEACDPATGMVVDRSSVKTVSVGGVGFQLSAICVGVERGWVTRAQGEERVLLILKSLEKEKGNRKAGLFYHYLDGKTGAATVEGYEHLVSTIDSALLFAGMLTASSYFGGEVATIADRMIEEANWAFFVSGKDARPEERGFVSLAWKPNDPNQTTGDGKLVQFYWVDSGDEHRLVTFLGVCSPNAEHRVKPETYYKLRRKLGTYGELGPMVWFPWSGALFTSFFAHCWMDYAAMGVDDPAKLGVERRTPTDWWENSRRMVLMHRLKAIENPKKLPGWGPTLWGTNVCDSKSGYMVPGLFPDPVPMPGARPRWDFAPEDMEDNWGDGTVAPYTAGCSVMFEPKLAVEALRHYQTFKGVWKSPNDGGHGFQDSFHPGTGWIAPDHVAIDQGPLVLAIENARTVNVWKWFHAHRWVREGADRLGMTVRR